MSPKEFDLDSFKQTLVNDGDAEIITPGGARIVITRPGDREHTIGTVYTATCQRCERRCVFSFRDLIGVGLQAFLAFVDGHAHTAERAS